MALNRLMHPDNYYKSKQPNFLDLAMKWPSFANFVSLDLTNRPRLDYSNPEALRQLTMILLKEDFDLSVELPTDRLVPTLPLRINYLLWLGDIFDKRKDLTGLDIGTGASCVYPLLGNKLFDWHFLAVESDDLNYEFAVKNVLANNKDSAIKVAKIGNETEFSTLLHDQTSKFDFCMCNPPFYGSPDEHNKSRTERRPKPHGATTANLVESVTPGGEIEFVKRIIVSSFQLRDRIKVYTTMLGKKSSLSPLRKMLVEAGVPRIGHTEFCQGRTMRWGLAWSFDSNIQFPKSILELYHATRATPLRLALSGPTCSLDTFSIEEIQVAVVKYLTDLGDINLELVRSASNCRVFVMKATSVSWANQRAKRRAAARLAKCQDMASAAFAAADNTASNSNDGLALEADKSKAEVSNLKRPLEEEHWIHAEGSNGSEEDDLEIKKLRSDLENENGDGESLTLGRTPTPPDSKKAILKCYLSLKLLPDKTVQLELSFIAGEEKEYLHQVFQFLKNKLVKPSVDSHQPKEFVITTETITTAEMLQQ